MVMRRSRIAPISQAAPCGRMIARWSTGVQVAGLPASIAGLPIAGALVKVGPPLSCSWPSSGSTFCKSVPFNPLAPAGLRTRLLPCDVIMPSISGLVGALLLATIVFASMIAAAGDAAAVACDGIAHNCAVDQCHCAAGAIQPAAGDGRAIFGNRAVSNGRAAPVFEAAAKNAGVVARDRAANDGAAGRSYTAQRHTARCCC